MIKGFRKFFIYLTILLIASISLLILVAGSTRYDENDSIMLNAIVQTAKENWENPGAIDATQFDTDFMIFGRNN